MKYLITFLDNSGKLAVYTGVNLHGIYRYLEILGDQKTLTTSGQSFNHFFPSSSINNNTTTCQTIIAAFHMRQNNICEWCVRIEHKSDDCITIVPKFPPLSLKRKTNQSNTFHGDEPTDSQTDWKIQPPSSHFKSRTYSPKTRLFISYIMGRLNHGAINNSDVEVHASYFPAKYKSESIPDPFTTLIKSIDDDEIDHLLELFH